MFSIESCRLVLNISPLKHVIKVGKNICFNRVHSFVTFTIFCIYLQNITILGKIIVCKIFTFVD